jgi:hypothetical protein
MKTCDKHMVVFVSIFCASCTYIILFWLSRWCGWTVDRVLILESTRVLLSLFCDKKTWILIFVCGSDNSPLLPTRVLSERNNIWIIKIWTNLKTIFCSHKDCGHLIIICCRRLVLKYLRQNSKFYGQLFSCLAFKHLIDCFPRSTELPGYSYNRLALWPMNVLLMW